MGGQAGSCSYFNPERAFVKAGPRAQAYRIPSFALCSRKGKSFCAALIVFICCLPSEHLKMLPRRFWIKLQTLQVTLGLSFPLPAPSFSGEKQTTLRETGDLAEGTPCPRTPSLPGLNGCDELMGTSRSPDSPTGKWQAGRGGPGRQKLVEGRAERVETGKRDPAQGSGTAPGTCKDSGQGGTPPPERIRCQAKDPGRAPRRFGHREARQETGLLGSRSEPADVMLTQPGRPQRNFPTP